MYFYTVYKTTNITNNKEYIGIHKTQNPYDSYIGSGNIIKSAIEYYGKENFKKEILFIFDNPEDMVAKEAELVNEEYVKREDTYNIALGGNFYNITMSEDRKYRQGSTWRGKKLPEDIKEKIRKSLLGHSVGDDVKEKLRGRVVSDTTREKIGDAHRGKKISEEHKLAIKKANTGRKRSQEFKDNLREINLGKNKHISEDTKANMRLAQLNISDVVCPYCGKIGKIVAMRMWHFDRCKLNPNRIPGVIIKCPHCDTSSENIAYMGKHHMNRCKHKLTDKENNDEELFRQI